MFVDGIFVRPPNHLNPMLSDIAKMIPFENATRGEDLKWSILMAKTQLLRRETRTDSSRIHYIYNLQGRTIDPRTIAYQQTHTYEESLKLIYISANPAPTNSEPKRMGLRLTSRGFVSK
jgi:hypothetical protein